MKPTKRHKLPPNVDEACHRKIPYKNKQQAQAAQARCEKEIGEALNYYKCILCKKYHLGHPPLWRIG